MVVVGAFLLTVIAVVVGLKLVSNQPAQGDTFSGLGFNRFPNSGIIARYLKASLTPGTAAVGNDGELDVAGIRNSSGTSIGGGTNLTSARCATTIRLIPAIGTGATTTISFSLTGISTSSNQVYFFGHNTSTTGFHHLVPIGYIASSTANGMDVTLWNPTSTAVAIGVSSTTFSLCYLQF